MKRQMLNKEDRVTFWLNILHLLEKKNNTTLFDYKNVLKETALKLEIIKEHNSSWEFNYTNTNLKSINDKIDYVCTVCNVDFKLLLSFIEYLSDKESVLFDESYTRKDFVTVFFESSIDGDNIVKFSQYLEEMFWNKHENSNNVEGFLKTFLELPIIGLYDEFFEDDIYEKLAELKGDEVDNIMLWSTTCHYGKLKDYFDYIDMNVQYIDLKGKSDKDFVLMLIEQDYIQSDSNIATFIKEYPNLFDYENYIDGELSHQNSVYYERGEYSFIW